MIYLLKYKYYIIPLLIIKIILINLMKRFIIIFWTPLVYGFGGLRFLIISGFGNTIFQVFVKVYLTHLPRILQKNGKNDDINIDMSKKLLICIYTNKDKNEFAIGLKEDENFWAMTKVDEFYTRFVDAFDQIVDENKIVWEQD